jgi:hypothetical protein
MHENLLDVKELLKERQIIEKYEDKMNDSPVWNRAR